MAPFEAGLKKLPGVVRHGFTHFELEIEVWVAEVSNKPKERKSHAETRRRGENKPAFVRSRAAEDDALRASASPREGTFLWVATEKLGTVALPTIMRKIISHALVDEGPLFAAGKK